jgi:Ca2+-binding EF-hand superfamily protein
LTQFLQISKGRFLLIDRDGFRHYLKFANSVLKNSMIASMMVVVWQLGKSKAELTKFIAFQ